MASSVRRDQWGRQVRTIHDAGYNPRGVLAGREFCPSCRTHAHEVRLVGGASDFASATAREIYSLRQEIAELQARLSGRAA
jgi:hypothetical protein